MTELDDTATLDDDRFREFLVRFDALVASDARAALAWVDAAPTALRCENAWVICRAEALRAAQGADAAAEYLTRVVADNPDFADAHYLLAEVELELGHPGAAVEHQLATLRLDYVLDLVSEPPSSELTSRMRDSAELVLAELPLRFRAELARVPVHLQARPSVALVSGGLDARALAVFDGPSSLATSPSEAPAAITLFIRCFTDNFDDEDELVEQVRSTVRREVGRHIGLSESQFDALGGS